MALRVLPARRADPALLVPTVLLGRLAPRVMSALPVLPALPPAPMALSAPPALPERTGSLGPLALPEPTALPVLLAPGRHKARVHEPGR